MDTLHLHPVARSGHGRNERLAVDHALSLQCSGFRKHGRRIDRVDQIDRAIERRLPVSALGHASHQLHQAAFAPVRVPDQAAVALQHAFAHDRIMRAADGVQLHAQLAYRG
ncbi:hypothetical protein G6F63_016109 [Rhizopus arrhizus]|nr:hypothetical protein G6F63_016109 [Rhizopus arrhizus]